VKGRIDLIADQKGENRVYVEVKVLKSPRDKGHIIEGFNQLLTYRTQFTTTIGYLVIYKACKEGIIFDLGREFQSIPYFTYASKMIFVIVIDIFMYTDPVSKRGKIPAIRITSGELTIEAEVDDIRGDAHSVG
jgi:hypothetical protein